MSVCTCVGLYVAHSRSKCRTELLKNLRKYPLGIWDNPFLMLEVCGISGVMLKMQNQARGVNGFLKFG